METVKFDGWSAQVDPAANRAAYAQVPCGAAEDCSCVECRNFLKAREQGLVYPPQVLKLLARLGVDPTRESEVYAIDSSGNRSGLYLYGGWFNVIGRLLGEEAAEPSEVTTELQLYPMAEAALPDPAFGDVGMFRIEFLIALPWLLDEPSPNAPRKRGR